MRRILTDGGAILATDEDGKTQRLTMVVEDDGTLKALTDQQLHEMLDLEKK